MATTLNPSMNIWEWGLQFSHPFAARIEPCQTVCSEAVPPSPTEYYPPLKHTIHASLRAVRESAPPFSVRVINGSNGKVVHLGVNSTDTISKLRAQFCEESPEWKGLSLALNGKPVKEHQRLQDLGVKEGATFVTFRRCHGG